MARWQPYAVLAALAAPPLALAVLVWPTDAAAGGGGGGGDVEVEATLAPGDSADGEVSGTSSADYEVVGDGSGGVRIDVAGAGVDTTLTVIDPETGDQLEFDDDTNGVDPSVTLGLDDGESVIAEVRSLNGEPASFTILVSGGDDDVVRVFPPGGPPTTVVVID